MIRSRMIYLGKVVAWCFFAAFCIAAPAGAASSPLGGAKSDEQAVLAADQSLEREVEWGSAGPARPGLEKMLDPSFTWIFSDGVMQVKEEVLQAFAAAQGPKLATSHDASGAEVTERTYGDVALVQIHSGHTHVLHVWVKRAGGWKLLHINEIVQGQKAQAPPTAAGVVPSEAGVDTPCVNPCKNVPFRPATQAEREALADWQQIETGSMMRDMDQWGKHVADECAILDSGGNGILTKAQRIANTLKQKQAGATTNEAPPLVSARMYDFGDTVVMIAAEQPYQGKPFLATRVMVKRDGRYQMAVSYHTGVAGVPAFTLQTQLPQP